MDRRLDAVTAATGGVFTTKDAAAVGIRHEEIAHMVRRKEVVRVRRGAFVSGQVYRDADVDERYRLQVMAALRLRPTDAAAAHAALALRRLPTWGADLRRIDLAGAVKHHESGAGLRVRPRGDLEVVTSGAGPACVSRMRWCSTPRRAGSSPAWSRWTPPCTPNS